MPLLTDRLNFGNIYFRDKTYTPDSVSRSIEAVAVCLNKRVTSNSPFVYLFAPNHIKMVYALFGIIKSGRICVLVDPAIGKLELTEMMADTVPGVLIRIDKTTDTFDFEKEFEFRDCAMEEKRLKGLEDVCLMLYTNASDGFAKAAMLTNESVAADAQALISSSYLTKETVTCSIIAFHHMFGLQTGLFTPSMGNGGILIIEPSDFSTIGMIAKQLLNHKVTHVYSVPLVYYFLKRTQQMKHVAENVRCFVSGGCKLHRNLFDVFKSRFNVEIQEGYGLTEASPICTWHRSGDKIKPDSVGRAFPCCEVAVFNSYDQMLPGENIGEICVKGANVMKGYYNNPEFTQTILRNGWLHTGDLGKMDDDGYLYLTGMKKQMLNIAGTKIYPAEVERLMKQNKNVMSVAMTGEPDEVLENKIKARVCLKNKGPEMEKDFKEWCEDNICEFKVAKMMGFS